MPYYEKRIYSGDVLEVERYYATDGGRPLNSPNAGESSQSQENLNDLQSWRKLWRMLACNFTHESGDLCVTLTFRGRVTAQQAAKAYATFIRKVRALRKKRGLEDMKYIMIREVQSGRPHAHLVINGGIPMEELTRLWTMGALWAGMLDNTSNHKELAAYLLKQHKTRKGSESDENAKEPRQKNQRRWTCSRNLKKPIVKKRQCRPVTIHTMPRAPKGYELMPDFQRDADRFGNMWIRWTCRRIRDGKNKDDTGGERH